MRIAFENGMLASGFDIEIDVDGDARAAGPARVGRFGAVAAKIPRRPKVAFGPPRLGSRGRY